MLSLPAEQAVGAEALRNAVALAPIDTPSGPVDVTISLGVARLQRDDVTDTLLGRADAAL